MTLTSQFRQHKYDVDPTSLSSQFEQHKYDADPTPTETNVTFVILVTASENGEDCDTY